MLTATDVRQINRDYDLDPPLTLADARLLLNVDKYGHGRWLLAHRYGDDLAASIESTILQAADD